MVFDVANNSYVFCYEFTELVEHITLDSCLI